MKTGVQAWVGAKQNGDSRSLKRVVGAIVGEILARMENEKPHEWSEWNPWTGRMERKHEGQEAWKRRLIGEVIEAHCPNSDLSSEAKAKP